jgi:aminodeoxyfutalosine synthase
LSIDLIHKSSVSKELQAIAEKVFALQRITAEEGLLLFEKADLSFLALLADFVRKNKNGEYVYYIRNIHIEPTNICVYKCRFCSYSRKAGEDGSWEMPVQEMISKVKDAVDKGISEIHIVGGVHPDRDLMYYADLIKEVKKVAPGKHIKAFTAIELDYMFGKSGKTYKEGFVVLQNAGLDSIPGGGAEIFSEEIRKQICGNKSTGATWLAIHEAAHNCGIPSNATMLYGHVENYSHRIDHLDKLRTLQDRTGKFNAFIPLKYRNKNNELSILKEVSIIEDLRNYAACRIFLDNFPHIKAYWPMIGKPTTQLSLSFGVDDIDGTIEDSTRIYSMAGVEDQKPSLSSGELNEIISAAKRIPAERDSLYNILKLG